MRGVASLVMLAFAVLSCTNVAVQHAERLVSNGDLEGARAALEAERQREPEDVDVRVALGEVYYKLARNELDSLGDETAYLVYLERSVDEFVSALEIDPKDDRPHFYLAVMDAYRGDLPQAMRGFQNTRRLAPTGIAYTNIAEIYVYMGHRGKSRYFNTLGLRKGAPKSAVIFNEMLLKWKEGDVDGARSRFRTLKNQHPEMVRNINVARLPKAPEEFEDFAGYCCRSPACGPYLRDACHDLSLEVHDRELSKETILQELRIEMEKTRRLNELYEQRKELKIEIEPTEAPAP
ncbi:MAG: tetratricopeptide repeat protein [Deltaproteobacteria bacterium]|nr:tetratricopeptide repeat protein [Deltaproteobacteria bacterium]